MNEGYPLFFRCKRIALRLETLEVVPFNLIDLLLGYNRKLLDKGIDALMSLANALCSCEVSAISPSIEKVESDLSEWQRSPFKRDKRKKLT